MMKRSIVVSDARLLPYARDIAKVLGSYGVKTAARAGTAAADDIALAVSRVPAPNARRIAFSYDLRHGDRTRTGTYTIAFGKFRVITRTGDRLEDPYAAAVYVLAHELSPVLERPAAANVMLFRHPSHSEPCNELVDLIESWGLRVLAPVRASIDGEGQWSRVAWKKRAWARLEVDFNLSRPNLICMRGEIGRVATIGSLDRVHANRYDVRVKRGEAAAATRSRLWKVVEQRIAYRLGHWA